MVIPTVECTATPREVVFLPADVEAAGGGAGRVFDQVRIAIAAGMDVDPGTSGVERTGSFFTAPYTAARCGLDVQRTVLSLVVHSKDIVDAVLGDGDGCAAVQGLLAHVVRHGGRVLCGIGNEGSSFLIRTNHKADGTHIVAVLFYVVTVAAFYGDASFEVGTTAVKEENDVAVYTFV